MTDVVYSMNKGLK